MHGVSTRDVRKVKPNSPGVCKSNVSRLWQSVGHKFVNELRDRYLSTQDWVIVMLDGIRLSKDQLAVAAIGITADGRKHVLNFELGSSESAEVAMDWGQLASVSVSAKENAQEVNLSDNEGRRPSRDPVGA